MRGIDLTWPVGAVGRRRCARVAPSPDPCNARLPKPQLHAYLQMPTDLVGLIEPPSSQLNRIQHKLTRNPLPRRWYQLKLMSFRQLPAVDQPTDFAMGTSPKHVCLTCFGFGLYSKAVDSALSALRYTLHTDWASGWLTCMTDP